MKGCLCSLALAATMALSHSNTVHTLKDSYVLDDLGKIHLVAFY